MVKLLLFSLYYHHIEPMCQGNDRKLQLRDGMITNPPEGLVEICIAQRIAGVCYEDFTPEIANLTCEELGLKTSNPG